MHHNASIARRAPLLHSALASLLLPIGLSAQGSGQVNTTFLTPTADTTIYDVASGQRSSGAGTFAVFGNTGVGANGTSRRYLLRFDVAAAVPAGATILAVDLTLLIERNNNGSQPASLTRVTGPWGEGSSNSDAGAGQGAVSQVGDASWGYASFPTTLWATPGGDLAASTTATNRQVLPGVPEQIAWSTTLDPSMAADVQSWLDQPNTNFGWVVRGLETQASTAYLVRTREFVGSEPLLTVTYVPPSNPATLAAFGNGCSKPGIPELKLQGTGLPELGGNLSLVMTGGGTPVFGLVFLSPVRLTNPGQLFGCPIWIDIAAPLIVLGTDANRSIATAVPNNSNLIGLTLYAQGAEIQAGSLEILTSNGMTGVVGL